MDDIAKELYTIGQELYTHNLIAFYNTPNLVQYLSDADRIDLEKTIIGRVGGEHA